MSAVLRHARTATMDITRTRALLTDITGLAGLTVESSLELVRGMAGVGADADSGADVLDGVGQELEVDLGSAVVSAAVQRVADSTAERFTVVAASMVAQFTVVEVDFTVAAVMVAEAIGKF
jgi:hypothetical protein